MGREDMEECLEHVLVAQPAGVEVEGESRSNHGTSPGCYEFGESTPTRTAAKL